MSCEPLSRSNAGIRVCTTRARRVIAGLPSCATGLHVVVGEQVPPFAVSEIERPARTMVEDTLPRRLLERHRGLATVAFHPHRRDAWVVLDRSARRPHATAPLAEERAALADD